MNHAGALNDHANGEAQLRSEQMRLVLALTAPADSRHQR
jgi:hypothetical protein